MNEPRSRSCPSARLYKSTVLRLAKSLSVSAISSARRTALSAGFEVLLLGSLYHRYFRTSEIVPPVLRMIVDELHEGASFYIATANTVSSCIDEASRPSGLVHEGDRLPLTRVPPVMCCEPSADNG